MGFKKYQSVSSYQSKKKLVVFVVVAMLLIELPSSTQGWDCVCNPRECEALEPSGCPGLGVIVWDPCSKTTRAMTPKLSYPKEIYDFSNLDERKKSFQELNGDLTQYFDVDELAIAGFYYSNDKNVINCYSCNLDIRKWYPEINSYVLHWIKNPGCKHLNENGTCQLRAPKIKEYADRRYRIMTFQSWPHSLEVNSEDMVEAGFYYTGKEDIIKCYYCAVSLTRWQPTDDPWVEHSYWNRTCEYLQCEIGFYSIVNNIDKRATNSRHKEQRTPIEQNSPKKLVNDRNIVVNKLCECKKRKKNICHIPCGHVILCSDCDKENKKHCPKCGMNITRKIAMYI